MANHVVEIPGVSLGAEAMSQAEPEAPQEASEAVIEEIPVEEAPKRVRRPSKPRKPRQTFDQAAREYTKPSFPAVVAMDTKYKNVVTKVSIAQFSNGYLTGVQLKGGRIVESKEMTLSDAYKFEMSLIQRSRSRFTRDKPEFPK